VALPNQLFYNTGISTYFWIVTNRKADDRKNKIALLDARDHWTKMRKSLGAKRKEITDDQIAEITRLYHDAVHLNGQDERVKVLANSDFGYQRITVERPNAPSLVHRRRDDLGHHGLQTVRGHNQATQGCAQPGSCRSGR